MEVLHPRCAGIDVHQKQVKVCVRLAEEGRQVRKEVREYGTTTSELLRLTEWLEAEGVTHVAMEASGSYWKPVWHVLEGTVEQLILANARDVKAVPGRKSDVNDCQWLGELLAHGLIRSSFVPPTPIMELGLPQLHASTAELREALRGTVREHHRVMLRLHVTQIDALDQAIRTLEDRTAVCLEPFRGVVERLVTIPGVSDTTAAVLVAETGADMSHFATDAHLISWAGLCPRLDESAGKARSRRTRPGQWLKTTLIQAAWAAVKKKDSYFYAKFLLIRSRRGDKKAIIAVAGAMLTAAYYMMRDDGEFQDLGADYFYHFDRDKLARRLIHRLEALGLNVQVQDAAA